MKEFKRQNIPTDQNNRKSIAFVVISLFVHFLLMVSFTYYSDFLSLQNVSQTPPQKPDVEFVDIAEWERLSGEIVEQEKANLKKPKSTARFLGEKDNQVDKETKAAQKGEFKNAQKMQSAATGAQKHSPPSAPPPPSSTGETQTFSHGDFPVAARKAQKAKSVSDLRLNAVHEMSESAAQQASQTNDYLKDVAIGAATHLNTREFLYFTYFNRIKRKLHDHWEPLIHSRMREIVQSGRKVATVNTRVTRLVITLDENGGLSRVQVATTSGLLDLDDVAIEALKVSAPFPNPPKDLIENGLVRINWDFILES